jgi:sugar lactone lactonase YvrE
MSSEPEITVIVQARTDLGESPVWDARLKRLYFVDINSKNLQIWDSVTKGHTVINIPELVGTVVLTTDPNTVLVALGR